MPINQNLNLFVECRLHGTQRRFSTDTRRIYSVGRRHENEWYLGSITNWTERDLKVPLSFLGKGTYSAEIYEDAADADQNPKHVLIRKQIVHEGETLSLHLAKGGGCAIRFVPMAK